MSERRYHVCLHCYESIRDKGEPILNLLETIFEIYSEINEPIAIRADSTSFPTLEYLEKKQYILTTEIPDPLDERSDIFLIIPLGGEIVQCDSWFFCFDREKHE